jgi:hypothetical protein
MGSEALRHDKRLHVLDIVAKLDLCNKITLIEEVDVFVLNQEELKHQSLRFKRSSSSGSQYTPK